jgi:hypothetical protein
MLTNGPVTVSCVLKPGMAVVLPGSRIQARTGRPIESVFQIGVQTGDVARHAAEIDNPGDVGVFAGGDVGWPSCGLGPMSEDDWPRRRDATLGTLHQRFPGRIAILTFGPVRSTKRHSLSARFDGYPTRL